MTTFEAWFDGTFPADECGSRQKYRETMMMDLMRMAWQASRAVALEEAAKRIEPRNAPDDWTDYAKVRAQAASDIRALANPEGAN